jgi:hypothetical protein
MRGADFEEPVSNEQRTRRDQERHARAHGEQHVRASLLQRGRERMT